MTNEFDKFDQTMRKLIKVPHSQIKAKLDAEKAAKKNRGQSKMNQAHFVTPIFVMQGMISQISTELFCGHAVLFSDSLALLNEQLQSLSLACQADHDRGCVGNQSEALFAFTDLPELLRQSIQVEPFQGRRKVVEYTNL
jgi:hypothetical protein